MNRLACALLGAAPALFACTALPPVERPDAPEVEGPAQHAADRARIQHLAPDFLARADRARERARAVDSAEAASEHAACADLLLQAARLEADRIELARQLQAEDLRRDAALRALAAERYRALARETDAALARAASGAMPALGPQSAPASSAAALTRRARLQLAAARVLGAEASQLAEAERQVQRAGARPVEARAALELAERVLAAAQRQSREAPPSSDPR